MLESLTGSKDSAAGFLHDCWPCQWAIYRGAPARLPMLFEEPAIQSIEQLLGTGAPAELWWEDGGIKAAAADPAGAARLYKRGGLTLRFTNADDYVPALKQVQAQLAAELLTPMGRTFSNVYLTPPGVRTAMHFDAAEVFIAQIRGTKRWRVAPNGSVQSPGWGWAGGAPDDEELRQMTAPFPSCMPDDAADLVLRPGDFLFLPRGCWHQAEAEEESISVSIACECLTRLDIALAVIRRAAVNDPDWRRPAAFIDDSDREEFDEDLQRLGAALRSDGPQLIDGSPALVDPDSLERRARPN